MKKINWLNLGLAVLICQAAGLVGSIFTLPAISVWYPTLTKPWFNPPAWIFGPVWTLLYFLMGISLYLVWQKGIKKKDIKAAVELFLLQLIFNVGWSIIFFGLHSLPGALIEIIFMWLLIVETSFTFYKIDKLAGKLLLPYLAWVSFASILSYYIWLLNR